MAGQKGRKQAVAGPDRISEKAAKAVRDSYRAFANRQLAAQRKQGGSK